MSNQVDVVIVTVLLLAMLCVDPGQAPFPAEHPLNRINPYIEPWWNRLTREERKAIYAQWTPVEPVASALADFSDAQLRAKMSLFRLLKLKADHLKALWQENPHTLDSPNDDDDSWEDHDPPVGTYQTPSLIIQEEKQAEAQAFLFWNQAAQAAKRAVFLEKLKLLTNQWPSLKNKGDDGAPKVVKFQHDAGHADF